VAPILPSSQLAPTTLAKTAILASTTPNSTTNSKVRHCKRCGRPKAGHPRKGCPFVDSPKDGETITDALELEDTQESLKGNVISSGSSSTATIQFNALHQPPRLLTRSISTEGRQAFIAELNQCSKAPPACVYIFPIQDIPTIKYSAEKVGFHVRLVNRMFCGNERDVADGWLILGRDERAVQTLKAGLESGNGEMREKRSRGGGVLSAAVGGAIVGAVVIFTGLAFL
jgi:hypothetical protein